MANPATRAELVGRGPELALLDEAVGRAAAGVATSLLIGGDAGMGKTCLVQTGMSRAAAASFEVLSGHCLDIEAGIPFGPVLEAVRLLLARHGHDESRPVARRVAAMLDPSQRSQWQPGRALADLRDLIEEAVACGPVLLAVEDLHWVERSTQDLLLSLARTVTGPLVVMLTFRTDELTRHHPLRSALVELGRSPGAQRIDLPPLDEDAVRRLVERRGPARAVPSLVRTLFARSEGNPLFLEELLASGSHGVPAALGDLMLARVDAVSAPTRTLLRAASVGGTHIDPEIVGVVIERNEANCDELLREAYDANLVAGGREDVRFWHGLLRDAIYDDMLPGQSRALHARYADALEGRADSRHLPDEMATLGLIAFHRHAARDLPAALAASVRAGLVASRYGAAEAAGHFERALELWWLVFDPETASGFDRVDLLLMLGDAAGSQGDLNRWKAMVEEAAELLEPEGDPMLASRVYSALGVLVGFGIVDSRSHHLRRAAEYAGEAEGPDLAKVLIARAAVHARGHRYGLALADATRAVSLATETGSGPEQVAALVEAAVARTMLGQCRAGLDAHARAVRLAARDGRVGEALIQQGHLAWRHLLAGEIDRGLDLARRGRRAAELAGLTVAAAYCGEQEVECLLWQGRLAEAEKLLQAMVDLGMPDYRARFFRADAQVARGDVTGALETTRQLAADAARSAEAMSTDDALRMVQLSGMRGDAAEALGAADALMAATADTDSPLVHAGSARVAHEALLASVRAGIDPPGELVERAANTLSVASNGCTDEWSHSWYGLDLVIARGHARRLAGEPVVEERRAAADLAAVFGAGIALRPRLWFAEELLNGGGRQEGRVLLVEVWQAARAMGARYVEEQAGRLARRTRVPLPHAADGGGGETAGPLNRLTLREREVLDVLATGATNKVIASRLFITEKTVTVHVTNVLAKLGVTNRGEAAALVRRLSDEAPPGRD